MYGTYLRLQAHVSASDVAVIRLACRKLKKHARFSRKHRAGRHAFYREMLKHHHNWQDTCRRWRM